jgi:GNAT superfamily N-acetyltransferase
LFESPHFYAREITGSEVPEVQRLYENNPGYFLAVHGRPPGDDAAQREFDHLPPDHLSYTRRWFAGLYNRSDVLIGVAVVVSDLAAPGVWHIAFFLIATELHGAGAASEIFAALEAWASQSGARWLRLGVVRGYARPERFWRKHGFQEVRFRIDPSLGEGVAMRVLVKSVSTAGLEEYLKAVPRDRPDSLLP